MDELDNNQITEKGISYKTLIASATALGVGALVIYNRKYSQFYKIMSLSLIQKKPVHFKYTNRKILDDQLEQLSGKGFLSPFILKRYVTVNWYCDQNGIPLTDFELPFFAKTFKPGIWSFPNILSSESEMFTVSGLNNFTQGTVNYDVRVYRPDIAGLMNRIRWNPKLYIEDKPPL
ncbi:hypothetical protein [Chryseobacterium populi]|uniref:Uncharacterized protein n=1 Tax=Chryseobacterium populi TaxID=1144316 RepID=J2TB23_9FLAO|nr:hypothetical protein [Chryseobacterium populi]EJL75352.1 hypothetical protein PMI13_00499 [Chryseobacterium populi]